MKTLNKHPQWYNQPLRLNKKEKHNPHKVIEDFFECYHLQDVREILWRWLEAVISSPLSISNDPIERSNHFYFFEKMERLVESAFIQRRVQKRRNRSRKKKRQFEKVQPANHGNT